MLNSLTRRFTERENSIITQVLNILSSIANYKEYFHIVMNSITELFFNTKESKKINRKTIITTLCANLGVQRVYRTFAQSLLSETDVDFCKTLIGILCNLILSDTEFEEERERLKYCLDNKDSEYIEFFECLFKSWCINPGASLNLTYLVQAYQLAYEMLKILSRCKIDAQLLKQLALLVQLLDSPNFVRKEYTDLRLQMLEHNRYPYLLRSLYGILVFLPTCQVYQSLQLRLRDISNLQTTVELADEGVSETGGTLNYDSLLSCFKEQNLVKQRDSQEIQ